ncbi:MAG: aminotransferase class V-fold PLP-dependent enzyme [Bacteroidota bacterium]
MPSKLRFETLAIQSTQIPDPNTGAVATPINLSTTFERETDGSYRSGFVYSRAENPNRQLLENSLAALEKGAVGFAFSSGMAAITALFQTLPAGSHLLLPHDVYYATKVMAETVFEKKGITVTTTVMSDLKAVKKAIRPETALIWLETPSNPQLNISDINKISKIAHKIGAICAVDNTWPSPVLQRPIEHGADVVMHSTSKYFGGHSDVLGGCLVVKEAGILSEQLKTIQTLTGAVPSPFECWLVTRGIKTLHVRVMQQTKNAFQLAKYLAQHPIIEQVNYPGLKNHPQHKIAKKQMTEGFGAMLSVQVEGSAKKAMQLTGRLKLFTTATSLGGVESLVEHRKSIEGPESPTPDNLLRISVGLEHIDDLIADWKQALG